MPSTSSTNTPDSSAYEQCQDAVVVSIYKFVQLDDCRQLVRYYRQFCQANDLKGTLLFATEGVNGTIAGKCENVDRLLDELQRDPRFVGLDAKVSYAEKPPFHRLKIKVRSEIVTMGVDGIDPSQKTGIHVDPEHWNELLQDPEVLTIDTRNQYEYDIGTFKTAISPNTNHFREFPEFVENHLDPTQHRKIAMFCTGGIRCEKASAYLLEQGFEEVYQLNGGILNYLNAQNPDRSMWTGECFVFDSRVAVNEELEPGSHVMCYACRRPLSAEDCQSEHYQPGLSCPYCFDSLTDDQKTRFAERWKQSQLAKQRNREHVGSVMPRLEGEPKS